MDASIISGALSEKLGPSATAGLADLLTIVEREMTQTVWQRSADRFEHRLVDETSKLRVEMLRQTSELIKWSFLFWIGQVAAIAALLRLTGR